MVQASADVARMVPLAIDQFPPFPGYNKQMFVEARLGPNLHPLKDSVTGDIGKTLWILMGTLGVVLLIACANVANLLLVRADGRQQEMAIRAALGAGWAQIARELLAESVALGFLGGAIGLGLAYGALQLLVAMAPALPRMDEISVDVPVLLFTLAISLVAGLVFGLIPVLKYTGRQVATALRGGGRTLSASRERHRARNVLAIVQVALALVLLIGSGLMIRTFQALKHVDPGFVRPAEVQTLRISISVHAGRRFRRGDSHGAGYSRQDFGHSGRELGGDFDVDPDDQRGLARPDLGGRSATAGGESPHAAAIQICFAGADRNHGQPADRGARSFLDGHLRQAAGGDVSGNMAMEMWGSARNALGKRIRESPGNPWREIVGVVGDEREDGVDQKAPTIVFWPLLMNDFEGDPIQVRRDVALVVRSPRTGSRGFIEDIQRAVWSVNPNLPLAQVRTLHEIYEKSLARTSFILVMLAIAGVMAMLIGLVGIYGVISYSVAQRRREIGIRMALGARGDEVTRMFVKQALALAGAGAACGLAAALGMTRLISSLLFGVNPVDPLTYASIAAGLMVAAMVASYIPALRATKVDPVEALRAE